MVTEPDGGSGSALVAVSATKVDGGWTIREVKTWATFAGRANALMLLARTDPDRTLRHRGLSLFVVEKPEAAGHEFRFQQDGGGTMEGRAIDTIGYRGMHSYDVAFDGWFVPDENLVGGEGGIGKGFYLTMGGFENGRLQTAGRALGVMQAAFEAARDYAMERNMHCRDETTATPPAQCQLAKAKLARMAALIQAGRQFAYSVAQKMSTGEGTLEAAMVKAYVCRASERVTREAQQIHGGMGYAQAYALHRERRGASDRSIRTTDRRRSHACQAHHGQPPGGRRRHREELLHQLPRVDHRRVQHGVVQHGVGSSLHLPRDRGEHPAPHARRHRVRGPGRLRAHG
jgi:(2S)-methylsuccinyl-CoA dehydrogenase